MRYRFGDFELDARSERVTGPQGIVVLRPQTFAVLRLLVERAPALVTHEAILAGVWGHSAISDSAVAQTIKELRQAFDDNARAPRTIETRPRRGYRLLPPVQRLPEDEGGADAATPATGVAAAASAPAGASPASGEQATPHAPRFRRRGAVFAAGGAVACGLALAVVFGLPGAGSTAAEPALAAVPTTPEAQRAFEAGRAALVVLDASAAVAALERARAADPEHAGIALALAEAHELQGDMDAARTRVDALTGSAARLPLPERLRLQAIAARLHFHWDEAAAALASLHALEANPAVAWPLVEAQIAAGRLDAAGRTLDGLRADHASHPRTALAAAQLAHARQQFAAQRESAQAAADWAARDGADALAGRARLLVALAELRLGDLPQAHVAALAALAATRAAGDARGQGDALLLLASVALEQTALADAEQHVAGAQQAFARAGHRAGNAEAERTLGIIAERRGDTAAALAALRRSVELLEGLGDRAGAARAQGAIGTVLARTGDADGALAAFDRAREAYAAVHDRRGQAGAWNNRGMLLARLGRRDEAQSAFDRALDAFDDIDDRRGQATTLGNLAALAGQAGQTDRAIELNHRALAIFTAIGARADATRLAYNLGLAEQRRGDLAEAQALLTRAAEGFAQTGAGNPEAAAWTALGEVQLRMGRTPHAVASLARARALEIADPMRQASAATLEGRIALSQQRPTDARLAFERARELREQAGATAWVHASELDLAAVALAEGRLVDSEQQARALADAFVQAGEHTDHAAALRLLADSLLQQARHDEARAALAGASTALARAPDAEQRLRIALIEAGLAEGPRAVERLQWVERTARDQGFAPLALRARTARQPGAPQPFP